MSQNGPQGAQLGAETSEAAPLRKRSAPTGLVARISLAAVTVGIGQRLVHTSQQVGHADARRVRQPADSTGPVEYEGELVAVIGKAARHDIRSATRRGHAKNAQRVDD